MTDLETVEYAGMALEFVEHQTPEICIAALQENGLALRFVQNQTPELCLAAVHQNGFALRFVREQTPEICLAAVKQNPYAIQYVREQTDEIYSETLIQVNLNFLNKISSYNYTKERIKNKIINCLTSESDHDSESD